MSKRLYVTGGLGPSPDNEGFTRDYDLPNESAYAETCAAVGLVFWASRMLGVTPHRRYGDVMEQALFNGALSGASLDGSRFFYENPLESRGGHHRWQWHRCPCCPPNLARLVASVGTLHYGVGDDTLAVHLYGEGVAELRVGEHDVRIEQATRYPWDGAVTIRLGLSAPAEFTLLLRLPGWCERPSLHLGGEEIDLAGLGDDGYARITRRWQDGDTLRLELPMEVQRLHAHPEVRADLGRVALRRGPVLFCAEAVDQPVAVERMSLPSDATLSASFRPDLLGGTVVVEATAVADSTVGWDGELYRRQPPTREPVPIKAIPYFAWDNREPGPMQVWLREANRG